ncbi:MAG: nucleoside deaminase [Nostocaceae cyanobacterium]|nr:nucleoside deaminase [Nostocaceae cyanobacterium]
MNHEHWMEIALEEAKKGDYPYGAVLVKDNQIFVKGYNTTVRDNDVSAHAEINVLRSFTMGMKNYSLDILRGYTLYTTCEPCPMCAAACVWSGVSEIVYGASIQELIDMDIKQIDISCETLVKQGFQNIKVTPGILGHKCLELFKN